VEYFGGALDVLGTPFHGKPSTVRVLGGRLFDGLPTEFTVGRYHSLHARRATLPASLTVTAETADGVIMAIEHVNLPIAAVQFHPESVMTSVSAIGMPIIASIFSVLAATAMPARSNFAAAG
jgi:anthranilate synthase